MRRIIVLTVAVMLVSLTGCGSFDEIKVNSAKVESLSPFGLKGVDLGLAVEIDNPAPQIKLSEMEATVKCSGKVLGKVTVDPFTMQAKSVETYKLKARMLLDEKVSLYDLMSLLDKKFVDKCFVDVTVKGKLRSGITKTIVENNIPLKKLIKYADQKK